MVEMLIHCLDGDFYADPARYEELAHHGGSYFLNLRWRFGMQKKPGSAETGIKVNLSHQNPTIKSKPI